MQPPLVDLSAWATQLGHGEWISATHHISPIAEVKSLSKALQFMANNVKYHTDHLEQEVVARTAELQLVNLELEKRSNTDALTGLPNRRLLYDRFDRILATARLDGSHGAMMFIDLDNFKPLNDTHGHEIGDCLLVEVARRLNDCVRDTDTVARFGGDEFVVLLGNLNADADLAKSQAKSIASKILAQLAESYLLYRSEAEATIEHHCTSSIGIALFEGTAEVEAISSRADTAMYCAKGTGRNRIVMDDESIASEVCHASCTVAHTCRRSEKLA